MCGLSTRPGPFVSASSPGGEQQRHVNPAEKEKRNDEKGMSSIPESRETHFDHIRKQLTEHLILEVKGQTLCRQLSFLENRKTWT